MPDEKTVSPDVQGEEAEWEEEFPTEKVENPYDPDFEFVKELHVHDFLAAASIREDDPDDIEIDMIANALGWRFGQVVGQDGWWYNNRLMPEYRKRYLDVSKGNRVLSPGSTQLAVTLPSGEHLTMRRALIDDYRGSASWATSWERCACLRRSRGSSPATWPC